MHGLLHEGFGVPTEGRKETNGENDQHQRVSNEELDKFYRLLEDANQELYPGLIKDGLPDGETLPKTFNETKKMIGDLGLKYNKIYACPSNCMLYWKEHSNDEMCHNCGKSSWKVFDSKTEGNASTSSSSTNKKIPAKVIRYFPLKPRLQRLFMSSKTASSMRWHAEERIKDGLMRHPADSPALDSFDKRYTTFSSDPRNPLIKELKELWVDGVETYDASRNEMFRMHAALFWTLSDFPGYAMVSGWSIKGRCKSAFDGTEEVRCAPPMLSGPQLLHELEGLKFPPFGKSVHTMNEDQSVKIGHVRRTIGERRSTLCRVLKNVKVPDGYASNISRCVKLKERTISGLKSHDCHILMQQLLAIAICRILPKNVCSVLVELSNFYRELCSKTLRPEDLDELEHWIVLILCQLEMIFPPAFFTVMVHLSVHFAHEARIARPVQYRWMYPIERYLMTLKNYVRNRSHPEGSIAEGYLAEECLTFCSRYLTNIETRFDKPQRNSDNVLDGEELRDSEDPIPNELRWLTQGPNPVTKRFKKFVINGLKFHDRNVEKRRKTQNSGVVIKAVTSSYARATDHNPVTGDIQYYGRGIKKDDFRFKLVNSSQSLGTDEPFILASQAEQVFYVDDPIDNEWKVVIGTKPRDLYDMSEHDIESYQVQEPFHAQHVANDLDAPDDSTFWTRVDLLGTTIEEDDDVDDDLNEGEI
ncbi:uncharacterized protein LOC132304903 [Cornus florida]|uniref:uncharacterized protein LOC132304903 n=1 Tax=Cornus florida TaxID=4283 RepID=UPI00289EC0D5|nr:uncharacterized protein LOC132304903 [Cornus florida]